MSQGSTPYREQAEPSADPPDPELLVAKGLAERTTRVIRFAVPTFIFASILLGAITYVALAAIFMSRLHFMEVRAVAIMAFGPWMLIGFAAAAWLPRWFIQRRKEQWLRELCAEHGADVAEAREFLGAL